MSADMSALASRLLGPYHEHPPSAIMDTESAGCSSFGGSNWTMPLVEAFPFVVSSLFFAAKTHFELIKGLCQVRLGANYIRRRRKALLVVPSSLLMVGSLTGAAKHVE
ncbi:hypothetical protein BWQ96_09847 [Gracilariopsis chorda]|uniref:Uncharacterized protein n=1 Tax=Gracilariopsis chorda TaxID=448386 RepID=A0A2V3IEG5_9FLOR|nr:hypothetical protein BWQ96_09847 [Gracilariopsis chorda]|eukprot:PXF40442.1 hypothetical protein BWQ96_09847 [Gracilariopsis chorda]